MPSDTIILGTAWIASIGMLVLFVPKNKIREAHLIFLFKQLITWLAGTLVVELRWIEYPFRLFSYANRTSFSFEYFIYPSICVVFVLHYPENKGFLKQLMYYISYCTVMTVMEALCEEYTNIIEYTGWTWYITWITLFITFYASRKYYEWFFKRNKKKQKTCNPTQQNADK